MFTHHTVQLYMPHMKYACTSNTHTVHTTFLYMHREDNQREHRRPFTLPFAYHVNNLGAAVILEHIVTSKGRLRSCIVGYVSYVFN